MTSLMVYIMHRRCRMSLSVYTMNSRSKTPLVVNAIYIVAKTPLMISLCPRCNWCLTECAVRCLISSVAFIEGLRRQWWPIFCTQDIQSRSMTLWCQLHHTQKAQEVSKVNNMSKVQDVICSQHLQNVWDVTEGQYYVRRTNTSHNLQEATCSHHLQKA